ncbi:TetR family transcriptional regulator [Mycobacterium cookii]|uniref:TetR family transcriptional regulator n=1 Tax=Mycobacterium cookii TaxID=1775 RepID=A0A7I7L0A9_9MYCO|nr:TetR family transcriptional regulator [Mycobacterium cookii]
MPAAIRRRPKDRKAQIARASADAFSAQGYHAVSMEDIASRVGISSSALYRHSPSKYDLFREAMLSLSGQLVAATAFAEDFTAGESASVLSELITSLVAITMDNRTAGGLYRWERRYLRPGDKDALKRDLDLVNRRLQRPLAAQRPKLSTAQLSTLSAATLSVIGSITDHSTPLASGEVRNFMSQMAADILAADLPANRANRGPYYSRPVLTAAGGTYEFVLQESMRLFYERGFRDTGMEDIAAAVDMQPSGLYRYFPGKADMLVASYRRAADRTSGDVATIVARHPEPEDALAALITAYVTRSFNYPEIAYVYYTERYHVPDHELVMLDAIQQSTADAWVRLVTATRPEMTAARARYAVYAAYAVIVDLGRVVRRADSAGVRATARRLTEVALLGRPARTGTTARRGR